MAIYAVANTKGGVGKTTTAIGLGIGMTLLGRKVWVIDGDRQKTAQKAITHRYTKGIEPALACDAYIDGPTLRSQLMLRRKDYDDIVIDVGGFDSSAMRAALVLCDAVIIPFRPRSFDMWAFDEMLPLLEDARSTRDHFPAYAVLCQADPGILALDNIEAAKWVSEYPQLTYVDTPLRTRKAVSNATGQGMGVWEHAPKDAKAINEMNALIKYLMNMHSVSKNDEDAA
ncbi:AAA family ATPase [Pseudomonas coronafaciens]|uniref:AAA family ATPase n=1 Tax=Pseudomonas coronafaciens TaxID=53409 RepID=UPI000E3C3EFB|nr:AAA family ATPase [Pseudomonas coronafaciens]